MVPGNLPAFCASKTISAPRRHFFDTPHKDSLPRASAGGGFWVGNSPDRVFCGNVVIGVIRECSFCVSFSRTPKGSRAHFGRPGVVTVCFVYLRQMRFFGLSDLCEFSQDPERLPCARLASWCPDRVFCVSPANATFWTERFV